MVRIHPVPTDPVTYSTTPTYQYSAPEDKFRQRIPATFPDNAADILTAMGSPTGWTTSNVLAIYQCDTVSPLVDSLGLGPNLVASNSPLTGVSCSGITGKGTAFSKAGIEFTANTQVFTAVAGNGSFVDVNNSVLSFIFVWQPRSEQTGLNYQLMGKATATPVGWTLVDAPVDPASLIAAGSTTGQSQIPGWTADTNWHCFAGYINDTTKKTRLFSDFADAPEATYTGSVTNTSLFTIGNSLWGAPAQRFRCGYIAFFNKQITSAIRTTFWNR